MTLDIQHGVVELAHGSGGRAMNELVEQLFKPAFANEFLAQGNDQAIVPAPLPGQRLAITTDANVVSPLFFPGGDIGCLAVYGTINDLAVGGAIPKYLSVSFILEQGFALQELARIIESMAKAAAESGVFIVTGDTKVVERGKGDGVYISCTGVGVVDVGFTFGPSLIRAGDRIVLSGSIGDHGMTILSCREGLGFRSTLRSDCQPLHDLVQCMLNAAPDIRCMRDPTRGGLSACLNELAQATQALGMTLDEPRIPVSPDVAASAELLGLDPLDIANEGKLIAICPPDQVDALLAVMLKHPQGQQSAIIGEVTEDALKLVQMRTVFGGTRLVRWVHAAPLPRIC